MNLKLFSGSAFCPNVNQSRVLVRVFYADLTIQNVVEDLAFSFDEMTNELAGIAGTYLRFSFIIVALLISIGIDTIKAAYAKYRNADPVQMWSNLPKLIK